MKGILRPLLIATILSLTNSACSRSETAVNNFSKAELPNEYVGFAFAAGQPDVKGFIQNQPSKESAFDAVGQQCKKGVDTGCYPGLIFDQCGAIAELQLGDPTGNPMGWAAADTLKMAMNLSIDRCTNFARETAIKNYAGDDRYNELTESAKCGVTFFHCTSWGDIDLEEDFYQRSK